MKNILLFACCLISLQSFGQFDFERLYKSPGENLTSLDLLTKDNGDFVMMYVIDSIGDKKNVSLGITSLNQKGSENWSKQYYISDSISIQQKGGKIRQMESGNYIVSLLIDTSMVQNLIMELEPNGDFIRAEYFSSFVLVGSQSGLITSGEDYHFAWNLENGGGNNSQRFRLFKEQLGTTLWSSDFGAIADNGIVENIEMSDLIQLQDENLLVSGNIIASQSLGKNASFLSKIDPDGNPIWNTAFTHNIDQLVDFNVVGLTELADSSIFVSGNFSGGFVNSNAGFIARFSQNGEQLWFKIINVASGAVDHFVSDHALSTDGMSINLACYEILGNLNAPYSLIVDLNGELIEANLYDVAQDSLSFDMNIENTLDGGFATMRTQLNETNNEFSSHLIKSNTQGVTPCSNMIDMIILASDSLVIDTLSILANPIDHSTTELEVYNFDYTELDLKVLSVENFNFCPNVPILATIDATVDGASSYAWNTGETSPTLTVDEEGTYMVTVTFTEDICYDLCDTSIVAVFMEPTVTIANDPSDFCNDGSINLIAVPNAESGVASYLWSNGATSPSISVEDNNTYTVAIIDNCGIEVSASASATFPELLENVNISYEAEFYCESDTINLNATASPGQINGFLWSTGEPTASIIGSGPGVYAVTVYDFCLNELTTSVEIAVDDLPDCNNNCLVFPNVFIPSSQEDLNRTFGPVNRCNPEPSSFTISIFNRWGQKVFESDNLETEWDGRYNEVQLQGDVYVYYAKYVVDGFEQIAKGDVTLLR